MKKVLMANPSDPARSPDFKLAPYGTKLLGF
jgi:hypothetical protein